MLISTDVGGTFTDYVILKDGELQAFKLLTTPDPSTGIIDNLKRFDNLEISELSHGTTVAVNAVLESKGTDVVFFTTRGFSDLVNIGRQARNIIYSFICEKPKLPVKVVASLSERVLSNGSVINEISEEELNTAAERFCGQSNVAVIGFLNSYMNPVNELVAEKVLKSYFPIVITSHKIRSEIREFDRFCSAIIEGYVSPMVDNYLDRLKQVSEQLYIMQSNGGKSRPEHLKKINLLFSGPAGGAAATSALCKRLGIKNVIAYDMGGTSVDISAIINGEPLYTDNLELNGIPIKAMATDIVSIGAGGGSIAWVNDAGVLKVGPHSAGSIPGPACYDQDGSNFTVSDANLLLGIIGNRISGVKLKPENAKNAAAEMLERLDMDLEQLSDGVIKIVNNNMSSALKNYCLSRGYDPREFNLVAFGGAGPMHACALAKSLGIKKIVVPPEAGVFSAMGILTASIRFDDMKTIMQPLDIAMDQIKNIIDEFKYNLIKQLQQKNQNYEEISTQISLDMRYIGQGHEINIPFSANLKSSFHDQHQKLYGFNILDNPIEVVNIKIVAELPSRSLPLIKYHEKEANIIGSRYVQPYGEIDIYKNDFYGSRIPGPCIIEDTTSTIFVEPDWQAFLDLSGIIHLECE